MGSPGQMDPFHTRICSLAVVALCVLMAGCASVPRGRYGVSSLEVEGAEQVDDEAVLACLATHPRPWFGFNLGVYPVPECDVPPFDKGRVPVRLWTWPWTDWPLYDENVFERDIDRVERWYRARGYYQARVEDVDFVRDETDREMRITISVSEGEPVLVERIGLGGLEGLPAELRAAARKAVRLKVGERFDEAIYDASKQSIALALKNGSYAKVEITGRVLVDPKKKRAVVLFQVAPGPRCRFGQVRVEGHSHLPDGPIAAATLIEPGEPYSERRLTEAQQAIYGMGAFASVEIRPLTEAESDEVDVLVRVVPARKLRFGIGAGIEANTRDPLAEEGATPLENQQWDVHLLLRAEHRNFFGGMRRMVIEERPRLIFNDAFPRTGRNPEDRAQPGNLLRMELRQPAFIEPRTMLTLAGEWDWGPNPYRGGYTRHDLDTWIGPGRYFYGRKLYLASSLHFNLFLLEGAWPPTAVPEQSPPPDYHVTFLQHAMRVDFRDNPLRPRRGSFFAFTLQHAGYFLPSHWDYFRLTPEVRGYLPLPLHMVLAGRVRFGLLFITGSDFAADTDYARFGPDRYRLRGGGPNSVRGFNPNTLGDVEIDPKGYLISGGLRQWEASLELRIPIMVDLSTALFIDAGDVTRSRTFRYDHPQTTLGFGFRYDTIVGPIRLDFGYLPPGLQVFGPDQRPVNRPKPEEFFGLPGTWHLSIGDAF